MITPSQRVTSHHIISVLKNNSIDVYYQDELLFSNQSAAECLVFVEWFINSHFLNQLDHLYHIHAGAVAANDLGMLFPATNEVGKSTFTYFVTQKGFNYYSDEIALIDPKTKKLLPFPKSISLIQESYKKVLINYDQDKMIDIRNGEKVFYQPKLKKNDLKNGSLLKYIFFLKRETATNNPLRKCSRGEGTIELIRNSFNPLAYSEKSFNQLTQLISNVQLFYLDISDLEVAYQSICEVIEKR